MNKEELKNLISTSKNVNWMKNVQETIHYKYVNDVKTTTSVSALHEYASKQVKGWQPYLKYLPNELAVRAQNKFSSLVGQIEYFVENYRDEDETRLNSLWNNNVKLNINALTDTFPYDSTEATLMIELSKKSEEHILGALAFFKNDVREIVRSKAYFEGGLSAYNVTQKKNGVISRSSIESDAISKLRNDLEDYVNRAEKHLISWIEESNIRLKESVDDSTKYKTTRETEFDEWLSQSKKKALNFSKDAAESASNIETRYKSQISELQKTYEELLKLKAPATYWKGRAEQLKKEGWQATYGLLSVVSIACITLYFLLWQTPEGMLKSFFNGNGASAVKWSVVYVTLISFIAYTIRVLYKVAFSSFHLSRDAEEREQLTYVYLSLTKDKSIDEKDRTLIIQSLFSRADTGLLKDDSSPTMPNNIFENIKK